jgi:hypothetical protein
MKPKLGDLHFLDITYKMDTEGYPAPVFRGSGIRVQTIVVAANVWDEPMVEIARQYDLGERLV